MYTIVERQEVTPNVKMFHVHAPAVGDCEWTVEAAPGQVHCR